MALRITFFALMALGLLGLGFLGYTATRPPPHPQAKLVVKPATVKVLVAARTVRAGSLLTPDDITARAIPQSQLESSMNVDNSADRHGLIGAMVRQSLATGDAIHSTDVLRPGDHGFLAAVLQPGMRAITVGVDDITGTAGLIWPGDRVDLILTQTIPSPQVALGHRIAAETVLSDVRVIAIDQRLVQGAAAGERARQAHTVTLEVTEAQAQAVQVAVRLGRLSLAVRSAGTRHGAPLSARSTTTWADDVSPALNIARIGQDTHVVTIWQGADGKEFKF